jgi:transcriptional regulator with XRE-family HTH domain
MPRATNDSRERGKRLLEARNKAGLTQAELADLTGLPRTNFPGWERGTRSMQLETAKKLAAALPGIEAADLVEVLSPSLLATMHTIARSLEEIRAILDSRAT